VSELPLILVIEDEYALQGIVEDALNEGGFGTDILSSGEEALTLFKSRIKEYKALVTDVNLKGHLSGWEVAKQVREINPTCPIIYMTSAAAGQWASHGVPNSIRGAARDRRSHPAQRCPGRCRIGIGRQGSW
jgi:DNA-binding response OmpR family regulator